MINRVTAFFGDPDERSPPEDFYVIGYAQEEFYVTREVAECVLRQLGAFVRPRWIRFTDLHGSTVSVRSAWIHQVRESTAAQRKALRAFFQARVEEQTGEENPWQE